jgi:hypothetical protein
MEGGIAYFPGLSKPVMIDSNELPKEEAAELKRLVDAARFFDLPTVAGAPPRGAADYHQYTVTVEDSGRRHTVQLTDPIEDPNCQRLLGYLRAKVKVLRTAARARASE